jgi:hypothetical protein
MASLDCVYVHSSKTPHINIPHIRKHEYRRVYGGQIERELSKHMLRL